jgi:hypothetical protein
MGMHLLLTEVEPVSEGLFEVPRGPAGRVERGLQKSVDAGRDAGTLVAEDEGLIAAAFVAARALDKAENLPDKSAVYAIAQLMRPYQDALNALRLPAALTPVTPPAPAPSDGHSSTPDWFHDAFGKPE